ncbi:EAL domain-containing protein [Pseudoalteromonas sp. H105]|uniref:EAL domain-containing protein n=1 Tax=Pseudoalteromonas sp. H105 TaxID=1348393 RepID=UPI001F3D3FDF|nr:EAL domain-containing protein [Pseudoalteromonas sp. H105]
MLSLRESFIALLPYFACSALAILVLNAAVNFSFISSSDVLYNVIQKSSNAILLLFPVMVVLSVGYHLSKNLGQSAIVGSMLALIAFTIHSDFLTFSPQGVFVDATGASAYAILIPSLTSYLLMFAYKLLPQTFFESTLISGFLKEKLLLILPFAVAFFSVYLIVPVIESIIQAVLLNVVPMEDGSSVAEQLFKRMVMIHGFWFFGVHGDNIYSIMFNQSFLDADIFPGLKAKTFYDTFVLIGGTGCFIGLIVAALFLTNASHEKNIARIAMPFSIFNFCEIILFALPVFLNPLLLIPFIVVPCFNFVVSYFLISAGAVGYQEVSISWMTPTIINGSMVGTDLVAPILQVFLIICNACIYYPFLRLSSEKNDYQLAFNKLSSQLNVSERFAAKSEQRFIEQQRETNSSLMQLTTVLNTISQSRLALYYQPQIDIETGKVCGFEALLRLIKKDGTITGPYFLDTLIEHKQTAIIDHWVIKQAQRDLRQWKNVGFEPVISINVNPDVLTSESMINKICDLYTDFPNQVKIEIVESSYLTQQSLVTKHIEKLRSRNIETVLDDFGTGYSSLSMLANLPVKHVKLDRKFLLQCQQPAGEVLYQQVSEIFAKLGFSVVAEGIETEQELAWVKSLGIQTAQGWLYAPALPKHTIHDFALKIVK